MKKYKVLFCDLDGTLIQTISGETFPKGIWDMKLRLDVLEAIKKLAPEYVFIVSNQGGIEKGFVDDDHFLAKIDYIESSIVEYCNVQNVDYEYCTSNDRNDERRKPNTGMLEGCLEFQFGIYKFLKYKKGEMLMIGDASGKDGQFSDTDKKTAENFGIDYMDVNDFINWMEGNK